MTRVSTRSASPFADRTRHRESPLTDSNRRPSPYHALRPATGRNQRQRFWHVGAVFGARAFATGCHWLRPLGSINAPSSSPESRMRRRIRGRRSHRPSLHGTGHPSWGSNCSSRSGRRPAQARGHSRTEAPRRLSSRYCRRLLRKERARALRDRSARRARAVRARPAGRAADGALARHRRASRACDRRAGCPVRRRGRRASRR